MKHSLLASSLLPLTLLAAACGGGGAPDFDAKFASADEPTRARAVSAAAGMDVGLAFFLGSALVAGDAESCPRVERDGDTLTVTGGCTTDDGRAEGRAVLVNVPALFSDGSDHDPEQPIALDFDGFALIDDDGELRLDGSIELDPDGRLAADLYMLLEGIGVRSHLELTTSDDALNTHGDSWIDIDGLGGAEVSGRYRLDSDAPAGSITIDGADTLVADFGAATGGCVPLTIDGEDAGELCDDAE